MIQPVFNGMITLMLAKFFLNDLPHAAGLTTNPDTKYIGTPMIIGTSDQASRIKLLINRAKSGIPEGSLDGLTIQFGIPERYYLPDEKQYALYGSAARTIYLKHDSTEYDFYHELSHYLDDIAGKDIARHAEADRFARKWGVPRRKITGGVGEGPSTPGQLRYIASLCQQLGIKTPYEEKVRTFGEAGLMIRELETERDYRKKLKSGNPVATGTCYQDAWRFLINQGEGFLIHGSMQFSSEAPRVNHAWAELPSGWMWEPQTKNFYTIENFRMMSPIEEHRYTDEQAAIMAARTGNHGPWTAEERMKYIGEINVESGHIQKHKTYKGYIIAPGITMPAQDIYEYEIFENIGQYEDHSPVHTAESELEAEQWCDRQIKMA